MGWEKKRDKGFLESQPGAEGSIPGMGHTHDRMVTDPVGTGIAVLGRMRRAASREALAAIIAEEVATYSLHDLLHLRASVERDLRHVPRITGQNSSRG